MLTPPTGSIAITVPTIAGRSKRQGIALHRSSTLTRQETTLRHGIPVTSPTRTLIDLRRTATPEDLGKAQREAEFRGYRLDNDLDEPEPTRNELERRFLRLCRSASLPSPEVNVPVGDYVPDFLWRQQRLIVETDGWGSHRGRATFEHDHRRQARLVAAGYEVLRFTWRQVLYEPDEVVAAVRARLTPPKPSLEPIRADSR